MTHTQVKVSSGRRRWRILTRVGAFLLLAVLIAAGYWLWNIFFPNPEHVIRKRFEAIARTGPPQDFGEFLKLALKKLTGG